MAEKKSWRDYTSGGTEAKEDKSDKKTSSWRDYVNPTAVVGKSVTEQLNNWLTNHNSYISDYQKRYEGRKYNYEDAYVSDSADWLNSATERRNALDNEANSILSYLDQYGGHLDPKILEEVRMTINRAKDTQYQIHTIATQDNEWWNSFNDEELVKKYGSAEGAYNYYQRDDGYRKKYNGKTYSDLQSLLDGMEDGEEKDWLTSYASSVDYEEKKNLDIDAYAKEIEDLADFGDEALTINFWYNEYMAGREPADAHKLEVYNRFMNEYGGDFNAIKSAYSQMNARLNTAKRIQEGVKLAGVADANSEYYDPEFEKYTGYASTEYGDGFSWDKVFNNDYGLGYKDLTYEYINNQNGIREEVDRKASIYGMESGDGVSRFKESGYDYLTDNEVAIYNYYYAKNGKEAAEKYLDSIQETLNYRKAEDMFKPMKNQTALEIVFGIAAGLDQFESGIKNLFNSDDYIPTSSTQYASGMVRDDLKDTGFKLPDWMGGASLGQVVYDSVTTTSNMVPSILASTAVGMLNPTAGAVVGNTLMGASAAGNAYQEALNLGYEKGQARAYSTLVGASEVGLQYLMGGIGKLGGKLSGKTAASLASKFDNAYARLAVKYGTNMLSEGAEEYLQEILTPVFKNLALKTDEEVSLITEDAIYSFLLGAVTSGVMEGGGTIGTAIDMRSGKQANVDAVKLYGDSTAELIQEGLLSDPNSESHQLAEMFDKKTAKGKDLSGYEIRQLVKANDAQIKVENYDAAVSSAKKRLTELGESQNVSEIAELVAKRATGQEMTRAEISTLARSQYGAQVAKEMRESEQPKSGTKSFDVAYKALDKRVDEKNKLSVSKSGQAEIKGETVSLKKAEVKEFVTDKTGKITDMVIEVDGKTVKASEIDYADGDQSYLFSAVTKIENITPADATAIIRDYDPSSGLSVSEYLNGVDEGFTYGYHGYSEADMKAGYFTTKLSDVQAQSAYVLGQNAKKSSNTNKSESIKRMRTAVEAEAQKAVAEGKEAPKAKKLTITYNKGGGVVVDFDKAALKKLSPEQKAAPVLAEALHEMGLGTNVELYSSYLSKTKVDEKTGKPLRVMLDENGVEVAAPAGIYRKSDGTVCIDLNAYNGRELTLYSMSHELTHFIQQWSDEKYQVLADFLVKTYEKTDLSMHERVVREQARLNGIRGKEVSYNEAFDEVVANAMMKMLADSSVMEKLTELKAQDADLAHKLWNGLKKILNKFFKTYENYSALFNDTSDLMNLKDEFEQMKQMWAEAFVEASENFQASLVAKEAGLEIMPVEDGTQYSYSSLAEAAGFEAVQNEDGTRSFVRDGKKVSEVTVDDIDNSPIGAFINFSLEMKDISEDDAKRQKQMFADICTMACKTNDFAMTMQFVGSAVFTGMKANADKQYGTTYDFPSICTKTQAVIDAMSAKMKSLGRGLTTDEIVNLYDDVFASGNPVPCPECYVFSRWIGIGGLLDNIKKYQDYYGDMAVEDVAAEYRKMKAEVSKFADEQGISFGKAKGALTAKLTKEYNKLTEKIEKAENQGEKVKPADRQRLAELEPMMNTVKGMTWLENVYFADSSLKKVNPKFRVPNEILFDLNNGEAFATQYKEAWAFRTTQGAGYGKAITPYAEARLGEGVLVTNNTSNAIKGKAQGSLNNYFLNQKGKLDKQSRETLKKARLKQKIQAFIGGQRFQSTSDARYENASDYLLAALEMQAMRGMVQVYTKVDGAVPAFSAWGFSSNQSLMPLNGGLDANGNVQDTAVGGMKPEVAFENRKKHESAGTITIGVNDNHIRAMFKQWVRDFIIPYHASGGKADVVAEFRRIQEGKEAKGKAVRSTDYSRTQSDKVLSDEVLRWQGKTDAQIQRIHEVRNARIAILTGGNVNMTVVRSNRFLSALYDKLNGGEWDGVKLAKSKVESQIYPNEFWDQTVSYEDSAKITKDYLEYCEDLGFLHRFSGMVPSNGRLVPVNGYNENGERVQLTDLAYKYDANGNKTSEVEPFFWKVLTDRRMYDNNRNYLPQKVVTLNDTTTDTVTGFAKNNQGRQYDKAKAEALAKKYAGEMYSSQETDLDTNKDTAYDSAKKKTAQEDKANGRREEVSHRVDAESSRGVGKENSGREGGARESCERRIKEILRQKTFKSDGKSTSGRGRVETKETSADFESRVRNDGFMYVETIRNALAFKVATAHNENASMAESTLKKLGFDVIVFRDNLQHNGKGVTETSDAAITIRSAGGLTIFISSELDIDGMETAYHEAFHAARYGMLAKYHEKIANIIASNVDIDSESFDKFVSIIADLYAYTKSDVSASKFASEIIEEFYAWYVGKAYASEIGDMKVYMAQFSDLETIKSQIDDVYAQMEANADKALPGLVESQQFSSQETDADYIRYDRKAILKESKVDEYLADYAAWSSPKYAQAYIAYMRPRTFLKLTTDDMLERFHITDQAGELDAERLSASRPGIYLRIDHETGKVTGHEGRHRMAAMDSAGIELVPVLLLDNSNKMSKTDIEQIYLHGQFDETAMGIVNDIIPLNYENRDRVIKNFATQSSTQRIGERYGYNKTLRFSTQETDLDSNRALLANAFEGITKSSDEYKLIQEYKGRIKILNEYEEKLDKLNAEISKMLFDKDTPRDAKKLKELQDEKKKVTEHINRNDKKLLSLEASEPLRKVIDRERKKEAQKTKDHVKELIQNKKVRAEQTELRHKIRKAIRDLDKILNRGNKKQNVKEDMKGFVSKALELADYLFTDHVSNDDLIRNGIDADLVEASGKAQLVKETEDILTKLYDETDSLSDEEFTRLDDKRKANEAKLKDLLTAQRNRRLDVPVYNLFNDLVTEYASLKNSNQDAVKAAYSEDVERLLRTFLGDENSDRAKALKNMRVADMTTEELWKLHNAYTMVLTTVRDANKFHVQGMNQTIEQVVGRIAGDFSSRKIPEKKLAIAAQKLANKIGWDYEKLYYALDRIGSEAFTELIMNIADSENTVMQDIMEAIAFRDKIVEKYGFNNWAVNKEIDREFMDNSGKKFKLTLGQLMSLYAYSRRDGAWDHIEYGGFVFGEAALTNPKPADSYKLSKEQCEAITSLLTKDQKGYVEDMQKFLSETMGEKGNEVSMLLYGIKLFGEKNYFPIHVAGQFKAQAQESQAKQAAGFGSMSNAGFTHAQNPNAKAPFVLEGFNEVWSDHVNEMSRYHGTVPALEDLRRVMNRSTYSDSVAESQSIKQLMENSFGKEAVEYFDNLYREANSGAITDKLQKNSKKLLSLFRKNSVAYSLSVLIQQPASLVRAYALIDKKYFGFKGFGAITSGVAKAVSSKWNPAYTNAYNEMVKYAPGVTMAKEIGGFDTATGGSIRSYLLDTKKSLKQKWNTGTALEKGKAVLDVVDDNAIANLPNVADKIAWIEIWNACKRETVATHKDLAPNSEAFMQAVGERFTEVIRATQVYDSIFAKSPMLKSKNLAVQYLVSFMNEPNTVANMVESAVRNATRGNWKQGLRTGAVVIHSIIFTNVLKSIIYALRDDDEDETYIEKYIESVTGGMIDDLNALNYIPLLRDVVSLAQGYDVERADMAIVSDAVDAFNQVIKNATKDTEDMTEEELIEFDKKVTESNWKLVESLAAFFGIPVKNVRREIMAVIDHAQIASANAGMTTASSAWDKVIESIPFISTKQTKNDKLYNAIVNGDKEYLDRLKSTYKTDDAYQSALRKALRENDSRIHAAAQARYDGNTEEYKRIFKEIKNEGKFSFDDIMSAVNSEENAIKNKLEPDKVTSSYAASDFVEAVIMGNNGTAASAKDEIIATHVANGKTQAEAEKAFVASVKTSTHDAYSSGLLDDAGAKNMLVEYADMDEEEAVSKVSYWAFCEDNPKYDYFSEANVEDYREFAEPADISVDVYAQFINGTKGLSNIKDEWGDVEVSKREQVLEVIDSLPLTWQQKDALYLAAGYSEDKIWDVPW